MILNETHGILGFYKINCYLCAVNEIEDDGPLSFFNEIPERFPVKPGMTE